MDVNKSNKVSFIGKSINSPINLGLVQIYCWRFINRRCFSLGVEFAWDNSIGIGFDLGFWYVGFDFNNGRIKREFLHLIRR